MDFIEDEPKAKGLYLSEKDFIKSQVGDLEQIRAELGLSRRKICQLLLVDPSSWTKWTKPGQDAPAYIYRSLQWALAILEKYPETHPLAIQLMREKAGKIEKVSEKFESKLQLHKSILFDLNMKVEKAEKNREDLVLQNNKTKRLVYIMSGAVLSLLMMMLVRVLFFM